MRPVLMSFALLTLLVSIFVACGEGSTSSSGTGGAPNCEGNIIIEGADAGDPCESCLHTKCCAEVAECTDSICKLCANLYIDGCEKHGIARRMWECLDSQCGDSTTCYPVHPPFTTSSGSSTTASSASSG